MTKPIVTNVTNCIVVILFVLCSVSMGVGDSVNETAKEILTGAGVQGGLVVHLGCGDGKLTAALRTNESYLVHGLDTDPANIDKARRHIQSRSLYGKVSVERLSSDRLPYTDNLVNLVVSEDVGEVSMQEILRVLAPQGVAYIKQGDRWSKTIKPRPGDIDEWTHFLHDPTNNAVANDTRVGLPHHVQWIAESRWARGHETLATVSGVVSANGRIFSIVDEGPTASVTLPSQWYFHSTHDVICLDAKTSRECWRSPYPTSFPSRTILSICVMLNSIDRAFAGKSPGCTCFAPRDSLTTPGGTARIGYGAPIIYPAGAAGGVSATSYPPADCSS